MARRRPLTLQQLAEIAEAARRGPDGKPLREKMRGMIQGTANSAGAGGRAFVGTAEE
jgi:hypothetical protein